ncbi:carboxymuconolactone decarboxylase family protein [Nocardioides speluncae]|uniref:carboxymuconolactone decarboxylase family protein n=1 Tax=Nocardioides speluncae TaxID=2670337 RepID=UPI000D694E33|nr:carboxymuconolactone decarboxylase family protein [Nocardioides speluncae]
MTTTENPVTTAAPARLDIDAAAPAFSKAMSHLDNATNRELDRVGIDPLLRELVKARVSQINGCSYCIDMHTKDARAKGETEQRLYGLAAWRETPFFTERERAALAFAEKVTLLAVDHVPGADWDAAAAHFSPDELGALVAMITTINAWNAIGVTTHTWEVGSYQP